MEQKNYSKTVLSRASKPISAHSEPFRTHYILLPEDKKKLFRVQLKQKTGWSRDVWFNKLHGYTPLTRLEMEAIAEMAGTSIQIMFKIN